MQLDDILNMIFSLLMDQTIQLLLLAVIVIVIIGVAARRRGGPKESQIVKTMIHIMSDVEKGKPFKVVGDTSRQTLITKRFNEKMAKLGMEPSTESGYIPVSYTPLARYLGERGVPDDIISAILAGLKEEESEEEVREIIEAAATTSSIDLSPAEVERAQDLAVEEWTRTKRAGG